MFENLFASMQGKLPRTDLPQTMQIGKETITLPDKIQEPLSLKNMPQKFLQFMNNKQAAYNEAIKLKDLRNQRILSMFDPPAQQPQQPQQEQFQLPAARPLVMPQIPTPQAPPPVSFAPIQSALALPVELFRKGLPPQ